MINILCIDESPLVREKVTATFSSPNFYTVTSPGAQFAIHKIRSSAFDVIFLGVRKSASSSLLLLSQIMAHKPSHVIILLEPESGSCHADDAWGRGAAKVVYYNGDREDATLKKLLQDVIELSQKKVEPVIHPDAFHRNYFDMYQYPDKPVYEQKIQSSRLIVIGASTGGIQIITSIVKKLKNDLPPILIVQHMPEGFTASLAHSLNRINGIFVQEAENDNLLYHGMIVIAPGQKHLVLKKKGDGFHGELSDDPPVDLFKPSVDKLFLSVAKNMPDEVTAVILTGMGKDGSRGMMKLKEKGAVTIAQDEESSPVYGMPREAFERGAASYSKSVEGIISYLNLLS